MIVLKIEHSPQTFRVFDFSTKRFLGFFHEEKNDLKNKKQIKKRTKFKNLKNKK